MQFFSDEDGSSDEERRLTDHEQHISAPINQNQETIIMDDHEDEVEYADDIEDDTINNLGNKPADRCSTESKALLFFVLLWQTIFKVSDKAILLLLKFFKKFLECIAKSMKAESLLRLAKTIPETIYSIQKALSLERDNFEKFGVCPKCKTLYTFDQCVRRKPNGDIVSAKCSHVRYPRHPHQSRRQPCGTLLSKTMRSKSTRNYLHPKEVYCYKKLTQSLEDLINKSDFIEHCEAWRNRLNDIDLDVFGDCYEGRVWRDFQYVDGQPFLAAPNTFGLMLNLDWFQPTKHGSDSIGVIYMVVMNLPREERFKPENMIIVGIIPGPKEPKLNVNTFLQPLVDDLTDLWDGVILYTKNGVQEMFRAAILALTCDIPASRKCGGFVGHNARKGCNKCFKEFIQESFTAKPDFSGFDRESWPLRTNAQHQADAEKELYAKTPTDAKAISKQTGARYSALYQLPYYDAVRFVLIDPMHNLLLGTAKHVLKTWVDMGYISKDGFEKIQKRVNMVKPPSEIGRIPSKIANGFSGFTADQWKNWVCIYSLFALKSIIPNEHYLMWTEFVHACQLLCAKVITKEECVGADEKLMSFCRQFEHLCGKERCTPNMHLHLHLMECILDYGPVYSFWCFSFERYNGILGDYQTNNIHIGVQMMRKFLRQKAMGIVDFPDEFQDFRDILDTAVRQKGTLLQTCVEPKLFTAMAEVETGNPYEVNLSRTDVQLPLPPIKKSAMDMDTMTKLKSTYERIYSEERILQVSSFCEKFKHLIIAGNHYRANLNSNQQASTVIAMWYDDTNRPAIVREFISHDVVIVKESGKAERITHILAAVEWYASHHQHNRYSVPVEVWADHFESIVPSHAFYLPVGRFQCSCVAVRNQVLLVGRQHEKVNVIIPLPRSIQI